MRVRAKKWASTELEENKYIIKMDMYDLENAKILKSTELFGNTNPMHVELGCGKGGFIMQLAKQNPEINYIAIEKEPRVIVTGARKLRELNEDKSNTPINNLRFIVWNVTNLKYIFEENSVKRFYINFCDPWQNRKKWGKRRLTYRNYLTLYSEIFGADGEVHFKTDNKELFEFSLNEFSYSMWQMQNITLDLHNSDYEGNIMTEYEEKFSKMGMPIYRLEGKFTKKVVEV